MEPETLKKRCHIKACHKAFEGHFPHSPIFPAVAQIDLVFDLLREHFNQPVQSIAVKRAKFRAILKPETYVDLELTLNRKGEARWSLSGQGVFYSMGDVRYSLV